MIIEKVLSLDKPVLMMRDTTERPKEVVKETLKHLLEKPAEYDIRSKVGNPYEGRLKRVFLLEDKNVTNRQLYNFNY